MSILYNLRGENYFKFSVIRLDKTEVLVEIIREELRSFSSPTSDQQANYSDAKTEGGQHSRKRQPVMRKNS